MRFTRVVTSWYRRQLGRLWLLRARRSFARGAFAEAASRAQRALALASPSFGAHLLLGKVYLRQSRFDRARFEFSQARFIDPGRFAAQGLPEDVLLELAQRFFQPPFGEAEGDALRVAREGARRGEGEVVDDFASPAERERFRSLPPIRRDDIERLDWSEARDLLDD